MISVKPIKLTEAAIARFWAEVNFAGPDVYWELTACHDKNCRVKITGDDVRAIRRLRVHGWLQREIAEDYSISQSSVSKICAGKH